MMKTTQTAVAVALAMLGLATAGAQQQPQRAPAVIKGATQVKPVFVPQAPAVPRGQAAQPELADGTVPSEIGPAMDLVVGKSTLIRLPAPIERISVGNPAVADVTLISARELYLLGKTFGSTNVIMWRRNAPTTIIDVSVAADASALEQRIRSLLPGEDIQVRSASDSLVLSGLVSSALKASQAVEIAESFVRTYSRGLQLQVTAGDQVARQGQAISVDQKEVVSRAGSGRSTQEPRVINMLRVAQPQQVMLEVKVAEISKNLLDKLGAGIDATRSNGSWRYSILSNLLSDSAGIVGAARNSTSLLLDAERRDGLIKVLAEPNIVAISGQEASFLAGGKIFIPVARENAGTGGVTITLEEKEFGVGLKFTPVVLDGGRIHLKVAPEVSELSQTGSPFTTINGVTAVLPSFTTRRAQTSVQLMDGQSLAIAGLIKNNATESVRRLPILGELPVLGTLFRSSEFQADRTELMFLITPRLVKPLGPEVALPTDAYTPPSRSEFFVDGQLEGSGSHDVPRDRAAQPQPAAPAAHGAAGAAPSTRSAPSTGGFSMD
ncbi:MAG: type II and III secretion system protein family protein [Burkholderiaceae bacterium]|nr:type II and III secretion system protein family protein [Burkholderiaceae bacterium]